MSAVYWNIGAITQHNSHETARSNASFIAGYTLERCKLYFLGLMVDFLFSFETSIELHVPTRIVSTSRTSRSNLYWNILSTLLLLFFVDIQSKHFNDPHLHVYSHFGSVLWLWPCTPRILATDPHNVPTCNIMKYRYAPRNDVSVNDGPHIRRWSHKIIIL